MASRYWAREFWGGGLWGEAFWFDPGAVSSLEQTAEAGFVEGGGAGIGARVEIGDELTGSYLEHDAGSAMESFSCRVMLRVGEVAGGAVGFVRGVDAAGGETFLLSFDAVSAMVRARLMGGGWLSGSVAVAMEWVCVELTVGAGQAELWVNGRSAGSTGVGSETATRYFWLGMIEKDAGTTGRCDLDEWVIGEAYVGPVRVEPGSERVSDPARWVVLYDAEAADSVVWAAEYRRRRGVPLGHLIGVAGGPEILDEAAYEQMTVEVESYLDRHGLGEQVVGLVVGHGVPGFVLRAVDGLLDPVSAGLTAIGQSDPLNTLAGQGEMVRPVAQNMGGLRIVARVDGASLAEALRMLDRAEALDGQGPLGVGQSEVYLSVQGLAEVATWAQSTARQRTRLRVHVSDAFESVAHDGAFWGAADASVPTGFLDAEAGVRLFGLPVHLSGGTGVSLRSAGGTSWAELLLANEGGYAAMGLSSRGSSPAMWPGIGRFFEALRLGWTLGEAWFVSTQRPGGAVYLVGDPLLSVKLSAGGWDIHGPLSRLEDMEAETPVALLGVDDREVELADRLASELGEEAIYLVRQVGDDGDFEAGVNLTRVQRVEDDYVPAVIGPVWPAEGEWSVWVDGDLARVSVWWERPARQALVREVELWHEAEGSDTIKVEVWRPGAMEMGWEAWRAMDGVRRRYRWRVTGERGQDVWTSWSRWVARDSG
ncbi:MAG: hypothetical protein IT442_11965 [Phycisphaeraceae bacterium]|nr:hypothetical protein [Phycisphaeraceae bacterium]